MEKNEQTLKKNSSNDSETNKTENDNNDENNTSNDDDEASKDESNSKDSSNSRAPPKRAPASVKSHPSHSTRGAPSFESQMSPEQIETNLIKLFGNNFPEAAKDNLVLSDGLSVRDLRIIVRVLKLCGPSQVNVRKPILCDFLMKHMQKDHMMESYKKFTEEKEKARLARQKSREEKTKHALEAQSQNTATKETTPAASTTVLATTRSQTRHSMNEKSNTNSSDRRSTQQNQRTTSSSTTREKQSSASSNSAQSHSNVNMNLNSAASSNSNSGGHVPPIIPLPGLTAAASIVVNLGGGNSNLNSGITTRFGASSLGQNPNNQAPPLPRSRYNKEVIIPRLKYDVSFDMKNALDVLQKCNQFVLDVSEKLTEMERALSIMAFKIAELEKVI